MTNLSKQTKAQLADIAANLDIDVSSCRFKRDFYEAVREYFEDHFDEFTAESPYYELAQNSRKLFAPKKVVTVSDESSEGETEQEETEEEQKPEDDVEEEEEEEDKKDDEESTGCKWSLCAFPPIKSLLKCEKLALFRESVSEKNQELREYLSDPYSINDITFALETIFLLSKFWHTVSLGSFSCLPATLKEKLPAFILNIPVFDYNSLDRNTFGSIFLWFLFSLCLPKTVSYYINFTYDFEYDSFTFALAKLFLGIILFKTTINTAEIQRDLDFQFGDKACTLTYIVQTFEHVLLTSTIFLRNTFGNWALVDAAFTVVVALYANLAFV